MRIGAVCGLIHTEEIECMLAHAEDEASSLDISISEVVWVPGSMETPLALKRMLDSGSFDGAIALGIIERGETQHGLAIGQAVIRSIIELQLKTGLPIGLGIIGPGAEPHHIQPRLEAHARAAVVAVASMSSGTTGPAE